MKSPPLLALVAALAAPACSSPPADAVPFAAQASPLPRATWSRSPPRMPQAVPARVDFILSARGTHGLALLTPDGRIVASAETDFPVIDVAFRASDHAWVVAEYEDDACNQISTWSVSSLDNEPALVRTAALSTEGYGRVFDTPPGVLLIDSDGLRARWSLVAPDLSAVVWHEQAPVPTSLFAAGNASSRFAGVVQLDGADGPSTSLAWWDPSPSSLDIVREVRLGSAWASLDVVKACELSHARLVLAQARDARLRIDIVSGISISTLSHAQLALSEPGSVLDLVCDELHGEAYALLSGEQHAVLVRVDPAGTPHALRSVLPRVTGRADWPTRRLALDTPSALLVVGGDDFLAAVDLRAPGDSPAWQTSTLRSPVRWPSVDGGWREAASDDRWSR